MWTPLINVIQLHINDKLNQTVYEGNDEYNTIYKVIEIRQHYYLIQVIEQNGQTLKDCQQAIIPFKIDNIIYHGFEIWTEE